ncbi:MAG: hypothetical protein WBQ79_04165 [Acidobacteriaceae bacterium]
MHTYDKYWLTNLGRGILALLASVGARFLPSFVDSTISRALFLPFAMAISILCLSLYGILDSIFLIVIGCILPKGRKVHWLVILQGIAGLVSLVALTILSGDALNLRFFVFFAGLQALFTALAEATIAIRAKHHLGTAWLLMCASISLTCSVALLLGGKLPAFEQARLIFWYLLLLGASLTVLSLRMLYLEDSPSHRFGLWNALTGGAKARRQATA